MVCTIKLDLPDDLYADVKRVSSSLGITIEEFIIQSLEEACAKYKNYLLSSFFKVSLFF